MRVKVYSRSEQVASEMLAALLSEQIGDELAKHGMTASIGIDGSSDAFNLNVEFRFTGSMQVGASALADPSRRAAILMNAADRARVLIADMSEAIGKLAAGKKEEQK